MLNEVHNSCFPAWSVLKIPRTIQRELIRLKDMNVIKLEGPDNGGRWVVLGI